MKWQQGCFHPSRYFSGKVAADCTEDVAGSREERSWRVPPSVTGRLCWSGSLTGCGVEQAAAVRILVISSFCPVCEMKDLSLCFHTKYQLNNRYALV